MRANKNIIIVTGIMSVVTAISCIVLFVNRLEDKVVYDLSLAIFGSALLGCIVAFIAYFAERKSTMELFWVEGQELAMKIRKIKHFEVEEPIGLIQAALAEETENDILNENKHIAKVNLVAWIEENQFPDDGKNDYRKALDNYYQRLVDGYRANIISYAKLYIDYAETLKDRNLSSAYGKMDFLFGNKTIRQRAYDGIYLKMHNFYKKCNDEKIHFEFLLKQNGFNNYIVCMNKIMKLDSILYSSSKDNEIYASFVDELDDELEFFRTKIYGCKAEYIQHFPVGRMYFDIPESMEDKTHDILAENTSVK